YQPLMLADAQFGWLVSAAQPLPSGELLILARSFATRVSRFGANGSLEWTSSDIGGFSFRPPLLAADASSIALVGGFFNTVTIGTDVLVPLGGASAYVAKLRSDGGVNWVKQLGGGGVTPLDAEMEADGKVLVTGAYADPGVFDGWILNGAAGA